MKLTKKLESEILRRYRTYWDAYLKGDFKTFASVLSDDLITYGTAVGEIFHSKKQALEFYKATADQMTGKADFRRRQIKAKAVGDAVIVTEQSQLYILIDSTWTFYGHARITAVFEQKGGAWNLVHQHASFPDSRTEAGEQVAAEKIKSENLQLREAVKRRIVELEEIGRELEIEAALERVRTVAMSMKKPEDMLSICQMIAQQLKQLGVKEIRNVQTAVIYREKGTYINYEFYAKHNKLLTTEVSYTNHPMSKAFIKKMLNGPNEFFKRSLKGSKVQEWYAFQKASTNQFADKYLLKASSLNYYWYSLGPVALGISTYEPMGNEDQELFVRFRNVFELSYRRYLDIEEAAAQAREALIEAALEKVRSRSLAMHNSDEIQDVLHVVIEKLKTLGIDFYTAIIILFKKGSRDIVWWLESQSGHLYPKTLIPYADIAYMNDIVKARKAGTELISNCYSFDEKNRLFHHLFNNTGFRDVQDAQKKFLLYAPCATISIALAKNTGIHLTRYSKESFSLQEKEVLKRFSNVFEQAYTRFLDLQKAEAQAREAHIEASLEKVRSRSMAMQKPEELLEVAELLRKEMGKLGVEELETSSIYIVDTKRRLAECWYAIKDVRGENTKLVSDEMTLKLADTWVGREMWKFYQSAQEQLSILMKGDRRKEWINYCAAHSAVLENYYGEEIPDRTYHLVKFSGGFMGAASPASISVESWDLLKRLATVFSLAYTRFKDLQDAAAREREAQIELALERVRSRSIGMQKSEELKEVIKIVYQQLIYLNIKLDHAGFVVDYKPKGNWTFWIADEQDIPSRISHPYFESVWATQFNDAKAKGEELFVTYLDFEEKNNFYNELLSYVPGLPQATIDFYLSCPALAATTVLFKDVSLYIENFSGTPYSEEDNQILMRFGKVFQQTYTRFLDLQKAEVQAREAQIEAALERVRAGAMAMHHSAELSEVAHELRIQMGLLGQADLDTCVIQLYEESPEFIKTWAAVKPPNVEAGIQEFDGLVPKRGLLIIEEAMASYQADKKEYVIMNEGDKLSQWFDFLQQHVPGLYDIISTSVRHVPVDQWRSYWSFADFQGGSLLMVTLQPPEDATRALLRRFSSVFGLAYQRFVDLKNAEAQAREAQIETALEKVRSRTLAMQKSDELAETAAAMFRQLINLGIAPNRLYIILIKEENGGMEAWVTDEDGSQVSMGFEGNYNRNQTLHKMYEGWKQQHKSLIIDMQGEELQRYFHYLHDELKVPFKGGLEQKRRVQHIAYFNKGLIGIASPEPQPAETMQLLERFAAVFNLTFTRFNDLKIAEAHALQAEQDLIEIKAAKQKAEKALADLQATQRQLVQSEKMASLGELTAGIAHEIQNPLNFVNNFSEVSRELLDEMKEELEMGNVDIAKEIMQDISQNLGKINYHGRRADGIVKGMLQHSRSSIGQKELTDINMLADEYLRLAYHGLRAKDKSFNAKFDTDLDASIEKVKVVPQDIGRVILNLINNAFYAVNERHKAERQFPVVEGYEPVVRVITKKQDSAVEIRIVDNGTGIPKQVMDKIFQPFFTTKPTGQGTGLGLSLSYDIITKVHNGELRVETQEGEGTQFIITLPNEQP